MVLNPRASLKRLPAPVGQAREDPTAALRRAIEPSQGFRALVGSEMRLLEADVAAYMVPVHGDACAWTSHGIS